MEEAVKIDIIVIIIIREEEYKIVVKNSIEIATEELMFFIVE